MINTIAADEQVMQGAEASVDIDGLVQERRNSSALAMEFRLSCTNPSIWWWPIFAGMFWFQPHSDIPNTVPVCDKMLMDLTNNHNLINNRDAN